MREDMDRVLVGRPRAGPRVRLRRRTKEDWHRGGLEEAPGRGSMSRGRGTKWLNENLSPLERFLASRVGRPWNEVYSEISQRLRPTNAVQQHVRDHLWDFVALEVWREPALGNRLVGKGEYAGVCLLENWTWGPRFHVCPDTGRLRERRARKRAERVGRAPEPEVRWDGPNRQLRRIDGTWYAFGLRPIPQDSGDLRTARDAFFRLALADMYRPEQTLAETYGRSGVYAAYKHQLGKRELARLKKRRMDERRGRR